MPDPSFSRRGARVHDPRVGGARHRLVLGLAVDQDQDGRDRREDDPRRVVLEGLRLPLLLLLPHRERGLEPVQLHRPDPGRNVLLEELLVGRLLARRGREVDLLDPDVLQRHLARALVHLRVGGERRDAEDRRGRRRRLDADGAVRLEQAAIPAVELGQVEADRRLARLHHARPVRRARHAARRGPARGRHGRGCASRGRLRERARLPRQRDQRAERGAPADAIRRG